MAARGMGAASKQASNISGTFSICTLPEKKDLCSVDGAATNAHGIKGGATVA